jgi:outer membrane cobalamin receptor
MLIRLGRPVHYTLIPVAFVLFTSFCAGGIKSAEYWRGINSARLAAIGTAVIEEVVVTGSRVPGRTATESAVPIDVVGGEEFENMGSSDMDDMLRKVLTTRSSSTPV